MAIIIPVELDSASFEAGLSKLEDRAKSAGKSIGDDIEKGGKKATKSLRDTGKAAEDLGDVAGLPVDKIKKLASGFAALGGPAAIAAAAVAAVAVAGVAMVAGIVGCVTAAEDLVKALEPISDNEGFGFSKDQVAQVQVANDALKSIGVIVKQVVARLGVEFAPVVEKVSTLLVKFGLMALDAFNSFADGHDILRELAKFLIGAMIDAMTPVIAGFVRMSDVMAKLARAAGQDGLANQLDKVKDGWDGFKDAVSDKILDYLVDGFDSLDSATGSYDERAKKLIGSMKNLSTTTKSAAAATKALKSTLSDSIKIMDEDNALTAKAAGLIDNLTASARKSYEERLTGEDAIKAALEDQLDALEKVYQQAIENATSDQQRIDATVAYENARVEAALSAEQKIREAQKQTTDEAIKNAEDIAAAAQDAATSAISGAQGGLASIVSLIAGPVAGAIASLILNIQDTISSLVDELKSLPGIVKSLPSLIVTLVKTLLIEVIPALLKSIPILVKRLLAAIPDIIQAVIEAIPLIIIAAVEAVPTLIQAVILGLPQIIVALLGLIPNLIANLVGEAKVLANDAIAWITGKGLSEIVAAFYEKLWDGWNDFIDRIGDAVKGIFGGDSKSHNDAPGMQRMGPQGGRVALGAGDYYLAGRDPQALLAQALSGLAGGGGGVPAPAYAGGGQINFAHQHRAFDGFFVRHAQLGGQTSQFFKSFSSGKDARGIR